MGYVEVDTAAGRLRGAVQGAVRSFLGVPYGADTAGANRFRPPRPIEPWTGTRDVTAFGPAAPQIAFAESDTDIGAAMGFLQHPVGGTALEGGSISEDCLRLNIWTPAAPATSLPVLVWLHGGGFMFGSGNEGWFNGDVLAAAENIIVVTVTHRLGVFGHLDLRDAAYGGVDGSANAGMLDIVAALRWIADNIAAFGGDPSRVTVAGHSGGAAKVAALLAMPAASGLFHNAIMQSGPISSFHGPGTAGALRDLVLESLGQPSLSELQQLPTEVLLDAQQKALEGLSGASILGESSDIPGFAPTFDAVDLPHNPFDAPRADTRLLIGYTSHEMAAFLLDAPFFTTEMTDAEALGLLTHFAVDNPDIAYEAATLEGPDDAPHLRFVRALGVGAFGAGTDAIARAVTEAGGTAFQYRFEQTTDALGGLLGACHAIEIPYVFGTAERIPLTGTASGRGELGSVMMHAWAAFARDGVPAVAADWSPWTPESPVVCHFSVSSTTLRTQPPRALAANPA